MTRVGYGRDRVLFEPFSLAPQTNWRGLVDMGTVNGKPASQHCELHDRSPDGGVGSDPEDPDPDVQTRCVQVDYPASDAGAFLRHYEPPLAPRSWMGSLIAEQQNADGLLYRRNRYYDPVQGRFTQEDPIGLAGGMNLYGYAAGDPVTFSDPFGLNPCQVTHTVECIEEMALAAMEAAVRTVNKIADFFGVLKLGEAATGIDSDTGGELGTRERIFAGAVAAIELGGNLPAGRGAQIAGKLVNADGTLRVSATVAQQLAGERSHIPLSAILEAVRGGNRVADPQGVANHFMYTIGARNGTLEVLVDEASYQIRHVLYRSP